MADNATGQENDVMDYAEHDRTYDMFLIGAKWGTITTAAILIGMAFGFFAGFGLLGGLAVFVVCMILAKLFA